MQRSKRIRDVLALAAVAAALTLAPGTAPAQQADAARPAAAAATTAPAAQKPVVRARDLMTPEERQAYRLAMREARENPAQKAKIHEQWRKTLHERAAARGAVLADMGMAKPGQKKEARTENRAEAPAPRPVAPPRAP